MESKWWRERDKFIALLDRFKAVSVVSHIRPDADAIGSSLGIYSILKNMGKRVEIANYSKELPRNMDFLPNFKKIKNHLDFDDSLIISCDCGSIDRLGFNLQDRLIVNFDHHHSNTQYGEVNIVDSKAVSTSVVAYEFFKPISPVRKDSAECFYAALISDTKNFTTSNVTIDSFKIAQELLERGLNPYEIAKNMYQRRSLANLRILGRAIDSLKLYENAKVAVMILSQRDMSATGAKDGDLDGLVDYALS